MQVEHEHHLPSHLWQKSKMSTLSRRKPPGWNRWGRGHPARSRLSDTSKASSGLPFMSAFAATPATPLSRSLDPSRTSSSRRGALGCRVGLATGKMPFLLPATPQDVPAHQSGR
jgi:hypothetical protein